MMPPRDWLYWLRRRLFGSYRIDDPAPIVEAAPYTYFVPSENERLAVAPGDLVQLIFVPEPASREYAAERMWIEVSETSGERLTGKLRSRPFDMPQLRPGARVRFGRDDIIDIDWSEERTKLPPSAPPRREYWERCLVDDCVINGGVPVHFLYREQPDLTQDGDSYPDSGWRIRGDYRGLDDADVDARELSYVALGAVLNADDGWLSFIDAPVGSSFLRDWSTGRFVAEPSQASDP